MKDRAIGPAHDTHYRITMPGSRAMYGPFCSCGWEGAPTLTRSDAVSSAEAHVKEELNARNALAQKAEALLGDGKAHVIELVETVTPNWRANWRVQCSCGWADGNFLHTKAGAKEALLLGNEHLESTGSSPSPASLTDERKSGDSVWERHKIGDCADPCVYCMDERAERRTRPAAEIREQYDKAKADITESIYHADVVLALGWVLGLEDYKPPMES